MATYTCSKCGFNTREREHMRNHICETTSTHKVPIRRNDGVVQRYNVKPDEDKQWAGEILKQLGGNRFIAMTGAKNFARDDATKTVGFQIGRNAKSVNVVKIRLNSMDTYDMYFLRARMGELKEVSKAEGIYNDQLQEIFTEHTGMYTSL
jgi:hypothetical protein